MNACRILETLQQHGIACRRDGDTLELRPATGTVPADLIELARTHKPELMAVLPDTAAITEQRARLTAAAVAQGIAAEIIAALDDLDVDGCQWLDEPGLRRYAQIAQENHLAARGVAILHPTAQPKVSSGRLPAVTCATCTQQQLQPGTSASGMHARAKGHGLHFAREQHACPDWTPKIADAKP